MFMGYVLAATKDDMQHQKATCSQQAEYIEVQRPKPQTIV
eukprot:jgi/Antlo1/1541/1301